VFEEQTSLRRLMIVLNSVVFLAVWASWIIVIHRHWYALKDGGQVSAIMLLTLFPVPYALMFRKREERLPPAFLTYMLLFFAIRIMCR
jgi:hypothetical protein